MQPAAPSEDLWSQIVSCADLTEQQRGQVFLAFDCYRDQRGSLLQEQAQTIQQLQALLGVQQQPETPGMQQELLQQQQQQGSQETPGLKQQQQELQQPQQSGSASPATDAAAGALDCTAGVADAAAGAAAAATASPLAAAGPCSEAAAAGATGSGQAQLSGSGATEGTAAAAAATAAPAGSGGGCDAATAVAASEPSPAVSCDSSEAPRLLDLESAEQAEQLLLRLQRNIRLQRECSRRLVYFWMDLLSTSQHASAIMCAYPFSIKIPAVCFVVWQQEQERRQQKMERQSRQGGSA